MELGHLHFRRQTAQGAFKCWQRSIRLQSGDLTFPSFTCCSGCISKDDSSRILKNKINEYQLLFKTQSSIYSEPSNSFRKQFLVLKEASSLEVFGNWEEIHQDDNSGCCLGPGPVDEASPAPGFLYFPNSIPLGWFHNIRRKEKKIQNHAPKCKQPLFPFSVSARSYSLQWTVNISIPSWRYRIQ